jgi:hypothetical protein
MTFNADEWLHKDPDRDEIAARETILDCHFMKQRARSQGCMADWVHADRLEAKAQAFLNRMPS